MKYKVELLIEGDFNSDAEYIINNPQLENKVIRLGLVWDNDRCFNYAFDTPDFDFCEDAYSYLWKHYKQIKKENIKEKDIIVYFDDDNSNAQHFAKVYKTDGTIKNTVIRSKWGRLGIYETTICGIPKIYGGYIKIWRGKNKITNKKTEKKEKVNMAGFFGI